MKAVRVAYLTIDDAPSADFEHKVAFLRECGVPAVFFCIGERLERRANAVIEAIRAGFVIGNHSFSHPWFSQLSFDQARREIAATDDIIERLYRTAGRERSLKLFRYPYGDKGSTAINQYLSEMGYVGLRIARPRLPFPFVRWLRFQDADSWWTFDVRDWCLVHPDHAYAIHSTQDVIDRLERELKRQWLRIGRNHVFLLHDHEETRKLFTDLIDRLLSYGVVFRLPQEDFRPIM